MITKTPKIIITHITDCSFYHLPLSEKRTCFAGALFCLDKCENSVYNIYMNAFIKYGGRKDIAENY